MCGKGGDSAPPPDPRLVEAQIRSIDRQNAALDEYLGLVQEMQPLQREQIQRAMAASRAADARGNILFDQSQEDRQYTLGRRDVLSGVQDRMVADAANYDQNARRAHLLGEATADINSAFAQNNAAMNTSMTRRGVAPSSGAAIMLRNQSTTAQAMALSKAARDTKVAARQEGYKLQDRASDALSGFPAMSLGTVGTGTNMAKDSLTFGQMGMNTANAGMQGLGASHQNAGTFAANIGANATGSYNVQASYSTKKAQQQAQEDAADAQAAGAIISTIATIALAASGSDRRLKENIRRVGTLDNGLPVYLFNYIGDPKTVMGVMADEVREVVPEAVVENFDGKGHDGVRYDLLEKKE